MCGNDYQIKNVTYVKKTAILRTRTGGGLDMQYAQNFVSEIS